MPREAVGGAGPAPVIGYYGKVPTKGDFVQRRLPREFLDPWDGWLQRAVAASKAALGGGWLDLYLTSPIWCFGMSPGVAGAHAAIGVLMPSVDSVGRYYPMTLAALVPGATDPFALTARAPGWFAAAEEAALSCLENGFEIEMLDRRLDGLESRLSDGAVGSVGFFAPTPSPAGGLAFHLSAGAPERLVPDGFADLLGWFARARFDRVSLWWSAGSDRVAPAIRICPALPGEDEFAAFLGGAAG